MTAVQLGKKQQQQLLKCSDFHHYYHQHRNEEKIKTQLCASLPFFQLEALEHLYRSTGLIFLQWQKKFLTIITQSLHFSSLKKKGMEKTCEKRRKKW